MASSDDSLEASNSDRDDSSETRPNFLSSVGNKTPAVNPDVDKCGNPKSFHDSSWYPRWTRQTNFESLDKLHNDVL